MEIVFTIVIIAIAIETMITCTLFDESDIENGITVEDYKRELKKLFKMQDLVVYSDGHMEWK